jgi:hypothetical protein
MFREMCSKLCTDRFCFKNQRNNDKMINFIAPRALPKHCVYRRFRILVCFAPTFAEETARRTRQGPPKTPKAPPTTPRTHQGHPKDPSGTPEAHPGTLQGMTDHLSNYSCFAVFSSNRATQGPPKDRPRTTQGPPKDPEAPPNPKDTQGHPTRGNHLQTLCSTHGPLKRTRGPCRE